MNVHKNARLTPFGRERFVKQVFERVLTPAAAAAAAGVSVRTIYKWLSRFKNEGEAGLCDRRSKPRRLRCSLSRRQCERIEQLRRDRRPYREIAKQVQASLSTVARYIQRLGLNRLEVLDPKPAVLRYEHERPGELVHLDTKRLVRFRKPGHRVTGDRTVESPGAGWEYLHVAIDDHSRIAYGEFCSNERGLGAARFLVRVARYYQRLGIRIARILTDNGKCFRSNGFSAPAAGLALSSHSLALIDRKPTARPNASSKPRFASGPTCVLTPTAMSAERRGYLGFIGTTGTGLTPASITNHLSAASAYP